MDSEIVERLARIETKLDLYEKHMNDKLMYYDRSLNEVKDSQKWFRRTTFGALIAAITSIVMNA